jgi:hypothetical protein
MPICRLLSSMLGISLANRKVSRRSLGRMLALGPLFRFIGSCQSRAARLEWREEPAAGSAIRRNYRADAQVVLLSVPLLRRTGVGGGSVVWSEEAGVRLLEFNGYSLPEHAAGLNRLGFIRELARVQEGPPEVLYFGLMTSSPEESAAEAQKALHQKLQNQLYTAIEGRVAPGSVQTTAAHFSAPARLSANDHDELMRLARQALSSASESAPEFDPRNASETTFLQSLAGLLLNRTSSQTRYTYSGRLYNLRLHKVPDAKATTYFRNRHLIPAAANVIRAEGKLQRQAGGKEINFQLWVEEAAQRPLPLRIEYQAKSYLRLIFEAE